MDEDDIFAIITRRMIKDSPLFKFEGKAQNNPHIDIDVKNISQGASYLTSLETLYDINTIILKNQHVKEINPMMFKDEYLKHRPSDSDIDFYYAMVDGVWNALIYHFPDLADVDKRVDMRSPNAPLDEEGKMDHLFLRPAPSIKIMALLIRELLEEKLFLEDPKNDDGTYSADQFNRALKPLGWIDWDLRKPPFINLILVNNSQEIGKENWVITEGTTSMGERLKAAKEVCKYLLDSEGKFQARQITRTAATAKGAGEFNTRADAEEWWAKVVDIKNNITYD